MEGLSVREQGKFSGVQQSLLLPYLHPTSNPRRCRDLNYHNGFVTVFVELVETNKCISMCEKRNKMRNQVYLYIGSVQNT